MFAVIKSGGRQYKVSVGQTLEVNRLAVEDGAQVKLEEVLLVSDENRSLVGTPFLENAMVLATAVKQTRGEKLIVFKYKSKKRYRHRRGHRQELTLLSIDDIVADGKSLITGEAPKTQEKPEEVVASASTTAAETEAPATSPATVEAEVPATPTGEATDTGAEKKTRRRRTTKAEASESKPEE